MRDRQIVVSVRVNKEEKAELYRVLDAHHIGNSRVFSNRLRWLFHRLYLDVGHVAQKNKTLKKHSP
jgi:glutathione peroxidase-family protein